MDLTPTAEQEALRAECRSWLVANLPWEYGVGLPPRFDDLAEEVAFGPANLGLARSEIDERVDDALSLAGIGHLRYTTVGEGSAEDEGDPRAEGRYVPGPESEAPASQSSQKVQNRSQGKDHPRHDQVGSSRHSSSSIEYLVQPTRFSAPVRLA